MKIKKIDTKNWKDFDLKDLFEIEGTGKESTIFSADGGLFPLVIAKKDNNGIGKYVNEGNKLFDGNKIVLVKQGDGGAGLSFYQEKKFYATSSIMILKPKFKLNKYIGLFIVSCTKYYKKLFNHKEGVNHDKFNQLKIKLPTTKDNQPDWQFMENYMIKTENEVKENKKKLDAIIAVGGA